MGEKALSHNDLTTDHTLAGLQIQRGKCVGMEPAEKEFMVPKWF